MFGMGPTYEAFAHFAHGGAMVFFMVFSVFTWLMRKQNRMMYLLFLNIPICFKEKIKECS